MSKVRTARKRRVRVCFIEIKRRAPKGAQKVLCAELLLLGIPPEGSFVYVTTDGRYGIQISSWITLRTAKLVVRAVLQKLQK